MLTGYKDKKIAFIGSIKDKTVLPKLHGILADYTFECIEVKRTGLKRMLADTAYSGYVLTAPLKSAAIRYLDGLSETAKKVGCVNTIVRRDGKLMGYNTDYIGFSSLLDENRISPRGKKVIVLGTGDMAKAVCAVLCDRGADDIVVANRDDISDLSVTDIHDDASIIVNTTHTGMTPRLDASPLSLRFFNNLETVIDVIYYPFRTELMLQAEECGIGAVGGLGLMKECTKASCELFCDKKITGLAAARATATIEAEMKNIILVGMPGCGKSVIAKELAKSLGKESFDTDEEISRGAGLGIPEIYELFGEEYFRQKEAEMIKEIARGSGRVVACGAGAILHEENIKELRRKSTVVFLRREIERLATTKGMKVGRDSLMKLYRERIPLYLAASDVIVDVGGTPKDTVRSIVKAIYKK